MCAHLSGHMHAQVYMKMCSGSRLRPSASKRTRARPRDDGRVENKLYSIAGARVRANASAQCASGTQYEWCECVEK